MRKTHKQLMLQLHSTELTRDKRVFLTCIGNKSEECDIRVSVGIFHRVKTFILRRRPLKKTHISAFYAQNGLEKKNN